MSRTSLRERALDIRLVATDFDGIHTNGKVRVDEAGIESVECNRRDGLAYDMLKRAGIDACIISKETNPVVAARARKLRIIPFTAVSQGEGKRAILERITREAGIAPEHTLYAGDDINDLEALAWAGIPACPPESHPLVLALVRERDGVVTQARGGDGVIRELVELLLEAKSLPLAY